MTYLLGIDFGGGAAKATVIDAAGNLVLEASGEYPTYYPADGFAEQAAEDWEKALYALCREITTKINPWEIAAVAVDSATHTALLCDADMKPVARAIHWTDARSREESKFLKENYGDMIFQKTNHYPDTIWTLPQLLWLQKNDPARLKNTKPLLFEKDYLRYLLTGRVATDHIEAQGSMLYDVETRDWSPELSALCGLDMEILPPLYEPLDFIGEVTGVASIETGLAEGTLVMAGTTDTCMEMVAAGAVKEGSMTVKLATAGRICVITDKAYPDRNLVCYSHAVPGLWYPGTATKACASSLRWFRDAFGDDYKTLDFLASAVPAGTEGLFYHPYLAGELTPYADPMLRGSFVGVNGQHTKGHFARAVMEGVGHSLMDSIAALKTTGITPANEATLIGGGAKSPFWAQMIADMLGIPLKTCVSSDSSLGSAMLAGVAVGVFSDFNDARRQCVKYAASYEPHAALTAFYAEAHRKYTAIHDALAPYYHSL
ncbi:MAG: xylulokinase [Clostridia bacterium]|nr:xylulokinase [Clostridia bacterium]